MVNRFIARSRKLLSSPQSSVLSAATIIMVMVVASRVLGLVRQRILANFFAPDELSLFFAAFRLPDTLFEVLVFGTFSSAFIPVFTKSLKTGTKYAWGIAGRVVNIGLLIFAFFAVLFSISATKIYSVIAPGFSDAGTQQIASIARILFAAQGFFVISYVLTGVLESLRRFLVPALAPIFYNLGIILGTVILTPRYGILAPGIGVLIGAASHFLIQLPLAYKLGFRFVGKLKPDEGVKKIGKLALPRIIDLSFDQIGKTIELFFASIISTASYTYFTFANSLQLLPVGLFGTSLAKAALPMLSSQEDNPALFRKTLLNTVSQAIFFTLPISVYLIVLRIPIVRLVYGTDIFDWQATVQTGMVLSVFAFGVAFQTLVAILSRAFFALHDTKTPVYISMMGLFILVTGDFILVNGLKLPVWALAASYSAGYSLETFLLFYFMNKRLGGVFNKLFLNSVGKILFATSLSGAVMYFFLKVFDRSVWVKRLSFLSRVEATKFLTFQKFVLDTRYTANLITLVAMVSVVGFLIYLLVLVLLRSNEVYVFFNQFKKLVLRRKLTPIPQEQEPVAPTPMDTTS